MINLNNGMVFQVLEPFLSIRDCILLESVSRSIQRRVENIYKSAQEANAREAADGWESLTGIRISILLY